MHKAQVRWASVSYVVWVMTQSCQSTDDLPIATTPSAIGDMFIFTHTQGTLSWLALGAWAWAWACARLKVDGFL